MEKSEIIKRMPATKAKPALPNADRAADRAHQPPQRALKINKKDHQQPPRLLLMVGKRRGLLNYLRTPTTKLP